MFQYKETHYNPETGNFETVAEWTVEENGNRLVIEKSTPKCQPGAKVKKAVTVEDSSEFTFRLMKARIKASGGASGLIKFMDTCVKKGFLLDYVNKILNFSWESATLA